MTNKVEIGKQSLAINPHHHSNFETSALRHKIS